MKRRFTLLVCGTTLLTGIVIGAAFDSWPLTSAVQADAWSGKETDRLYRELDTDGNVLIQGSQLLAKIAKLTIPSVVKIKSERSNRRGSMIEETGSGVLTTSSKSNGTFVVTNRHVVRGYEEKSISIYLHDGRVIHPARIWTDPATDLAVMKVTAKNLHAARWGDSDEVQIGHMVLAMGSPFGLSHSVTYGIISAKERRSLKLGPAASILNQDFLQTDAAINPGNSGGPLIDLHGRLIGINTAIASNSGGNEGIGFSIPSNLVRRIVDQLLEHNEVRRAYLGVKLDAKFDADRARRLKLDRVHGARVELVYPNTPASRAELKSDDVILSFDGIDVQDFDHLIHLVSLTPVGKQVRLVVMRSGMKTTLTVHLRDRTELEQRSEAPPRERLGFPVELMGLTLHRLDRDLAAQIGCKGTPQGLLVLDIDAGTSLSSEVQLYDLIEEVARTPVTSIDDLNRVLQAHQTSDSILLKVRRQVDGQPQSRLVVWTR